jgi:hypothetical protein
MYFVCVYENRTMKSAEIVLRREGIRKNNGGVNPINMHCKHICKCHNEYSPVQLKYANKLKKN